MTSPPVDNLDPAQLATEFKEINALVAKGDAGGQEYYAEAGRRLTILKAQTPKGSSWANFLREHCSNISPRWARTLMAIGAGRETLASVRKANREAASRSRFKKLYSPKRARRDVTPPTDEQLIEQAILRAGLNGRSRGKFEDTVAVLGLVVDSDADKGKGGNVSAAASLTVETSPGNLHLWYLFDQAVAASAAKEIGDLMRRSSGADDDTGTVTQVYRVAGTPNFPNAAKRKRGRTAIEATRIVAHDAERLYSPEALRAAFPVHAGAADAEPGQGSADEGKLPSKLRKLIREGAGEGEDRSKRFFDVVGRLRKRGWSGADIAALLERYPQGIAAKYAEGGRIAAEVERAFGKQQAEAGGEAGGEAAGKVAEQCAAVIDEFNSNYMVVNENGTVLVYSERYDPVMKRQVYDFMKPGALQTLYANRSVCTKVDAEGKRSYRNAAQFWLTHKERRQYIRGVVFDPSGEPTPDGMLNLWRGFAVEPAKGSWRLLREHIRENICCGIEQHFDYIMGWTASMFQHPAQQGEVALVLRGDPGTGKGKFGHTLRHLLGQHAVYISSSNHLVGNFNLHLRDCVFLFADEAFFAGDPRGLGRLKGLITEPVIPIEGKFRNMYLAPNLLHILMASNSDWVVPASLQERRYFVRDVSDARMRDFKYFAAIDRELKAGGYEAMLYDLLHYDLGGFDVRAVPETKALQDQKKLSLDTEHAWWHDVLTRGFVYQSKLGLEDYFGEWHESVSTALLFDSYATFAKGHGAYHPKSREAIGLFIRKKAGGRAMRSRNGVIGEHMTPDGVRLAEKVHQDQAHSYHFGDLDQARAMFADNTGLAFKWDK